MRLFIVILTLASSLIADDTWTTHMTGTQKTVAFDSVNNQIVSRTHFIDVDDFTKTYYGKSDFTPKYTQVDFEGHIWSSALFDGAYEYDGTQWIDHRNYNTTNDGVIQLQRASDGTIWFTTGFGTGTYIYTGTTDSLANSYTSNIIREDANNNIWIAGTGHNGTTGTVMTWDGSTWSTITVPPLISDGHAYEDLALASDGTLWIATRTLAYADRDTTGGLLRMTPDGTWSLFSHHDGLPSCAIMSVEVDHNDVVWIGTVRGLADYDGQIVTAWSESNWGVDSTIFDAEIIYDITVDSKNRIWIATLGLHCLTRDPITSTTVAPITAPKHDITIHNTSKSFSLQFTENITTPVTVQIYSPRGQLVQEISQSKIQQKKIEFPKRESLAPGIYYLSINYNNRLITKSIIY